VVPHVERVVQLVVELVLENEIGTEGGRWKFGCSLWDGTTRKQVDCDTVGDEESCGGGQQRERSPEDPVDERFRLTPGVIDSIPTDPVELSGGTIPESASGELLGLDERPIDLLDRPTKVGNHSSVDLRIEGLLGRG
jgi:hypothetical protein